MKTIFDRSYDHIFPYVAYIPEDVSDRPGILFHLHGAGERGNGGADLEKVLVHGFPNTVNDQNFKNCILIMPQCPTDTFWVARIESIRRFIDEMAALYCADSSRLYLAGLSMGGYGTWYTAMAYPDLFAAIAPCCGGGMAWNAGVLTMPIWTFHGLADTLVSPKNTIEMIDALKDTHPNFRYDLYEGVGHDSWRTGFNEETLAWLLQHKKET